MSGEAHRSSFPASPVMSRALLDLILRVLIDTLIVGNYTRVICEIVLR
jgi:hypothetical protein